MAKAAGSGLEVRCGQKCEMSSEVIAKSERKSEMTSGGLVPKPVTNELGTGARMSCQGREEVHPDRRSQRCGVGMRDIAILLTMIFY